MRQRKYLVWTGEMVNRETGLNPRTFALRANKAGVKAAYPGGYSTKQVLAILHGDYDAERTRETKENADRLAMANAKSRGEVVEANGVFRIYENLCVSIRQVIKQSGLSEVEKHEVLKNLRELSVEDLTAEQVEQEAA